MTEKETRKFIAEAVKLLKALVERSDKLGTKRVPVAERQYQKAKQLIAQAEKN